MKNELGKLMDGKGSMTLDVARLVETTAQKCPLCAHESPLVLKSVVICPDCNLSVPHHGKDAPVYVTALEKWNDLPRFARVEELKLDRIKVKSGLINWEISADDVADLRRDWLVLHTKISILEAESNKQSALLLEADSFVSRLQAQRDEAIKNKEIHWKLNDSAMKREKETMERSEVYRQALESICKLEGDGAVTARIFAKAAMLKAAEI